MTSASRRYLRRTDARLVGAALVHAGALAVLVASRGAWGIPRNDGWGYSRIAFGQAATGRFEPDVWTQAMSVGQSLLVQPALAVTGPNEAALQVVVLLLGCIGLVASWATLRLLVPPFWSSIVVAGIALGPLYGSLATSFMTDVPAFALSACALYSGARAVVGRRVRPGLLALALALAFAAFSVREFAVAVAGALVLTSVLLADKWRTRLNALTLGLVWTIAAVVLRDWRAGLPGSRPLAVQVVDARSVATVLLGLMPSLALFLAPVVAAGVVQARGWLMRLSIVVLSIGGAAVLHGHAGFLPNYVSLHGSYQQAFPGAPDPAWPGPLWGLVDTASLAAGVALVLLAALAVPRVLGAFRRRGGERRDSSRRPEDAHQPDRGVLLLCAITASGSLIVPLIVTSLTGGGMFDRYLLTSAVPIAAVLLGWTHDTYGARAVAAAAVAATAFVGLVATDAAAVVDGLFWRAGERAVADTGRPAERVSAGYAWWGAHQSGPPVLPVQRPVPAEWGFWVGLYDGPPPCATVVAGRRDGSGVVDRLEARTLLGQRLRVTVLDTGRC